MPISDRVQSWFDDVGSPVRIGGKVADMRIRQAPTVMVTNGTSGSVNLTATTTNVTSSGGSWNRSDWDTINIDVSPGVSWVRDDAHQSYKLMIPGPTGAGQWEMRIADDALRDATKLVQYHPPPLQFNPYVNASDLLVDFMKYVGECGVSQSEVLDLPLGLLVNWLVLEAARADGEEKPADISVFPRAVNCLHCGRFVPPRRVRFPFCDAGHFQRALSAAKTEEIKELIAA